MARFPRKKSLWVEGSAKLLSHARFAFQHEYLQNLQNAKLTDQSYRPELKRRAFKFREQNAIGCSDERSGTTFHLPAPGGRMGVWCARAAWTSTVYEKLPLLYPHSADRTNAPAHLGSHCGLHVFLRLRRPPGPRSNTVWTGGRIDRSGGRTARNQPRSPKPSNRPVFATWD